MPSKQKAQTVAIPEHYKVPPIITDVWNSFTPEQRKEVLGHLQEYTMLTGFRDLVGERAGYDLGRRLTQADMSEKTKEERKTAREIRKEITDSLEEYIKNSDIDTYLSKRKDLKTAREVVSKKSKPFREKISPLTRALKYLDNTAIPDALKELGTPVQERFSLSDWIKKAMIPMK